MKRVKRALSQKAVELVGGRCPTCSRAVGTKDVFGYAPPFNTIGKITVACPLCRRSGSFFPLSRFAQNVVKASPEIISRLILKSLMEEKRDNQSEEEKELWQGWTHVERRIAERVVGVPDKKRAQKILSCTYGILKARGENSRITPTTTRGGVVYVPGYGGPYLSKSKHRNIYEWSTWYPETKRTRKAALQEAWAIEAGGQIKACIEGVLGEDMARRNPGKQSVALYQDILALLRAVHWVSWQAHWVAKGPSFYADHLLFERLYTGKKAPDIEEAIDTLAEKMVYSYGPESVTSLRILEKTTYAIANTYATTQVQLLMALEAQLIEAIQLAWEDNDVNNKSLGLDDYLASLANERETVLYLLSRRMA